MIKSRALRALVNRSFKQNLWELRALPEKFFYEKQEYAAKVDLPDLGLEAFITFTKFKRHIMIRLVDVNEASTNFKKVERFWISSWPSMLSIVGLFLRRKRLARLKERRQQVLLRELEAEFQRQEYSKTLQNARDERARRNIK